MSLPYSSPTWPRDADRDHYRAVARRGYPNASDGQIEQLAQAGATLDARCVPFKTPKGLCGGLVKLSERGAVFDGEHVSEVEAEKLRALQPKRSTLGVRWAA
jgi:hypothetical protein